MNLYNISIEPTNDYKNIGVKDIFVFYLKGCKSKRILRKNKTYSK